MSLLKKLAGDTVLYGLSSIVGRLLNWLLVIVHTRIFEQPRLLADNAQLYTYVIPLNIIFTFGMETAFFRYGSKKENQSDVFSLLLTALILWGGTLSLLFVLFATPLINAIGYPGKEHLIYWMSAILWLDTIAALAFVKLRAQNKAKRFVGIKLINIFINIFLNAFFLIFCNYILQGLFLSELTPFARFFYNPALGPDYIIVANLVASLSTILLLYPQFSDFKWTISSEKLKPILKYAFPLVIMGLAGAVNLTADRLLFRSFLPAGFYPGQSTDDAFSVYAQVYKLSIFMALVVQAYRYAADPLFFSKMGDKNSPALIALSTHWFTLACLIIWLGVSINLDWIGLLIGSTYRSGLLVVPLLLLANLFIGVYGNISIWLKLIDKTQIGTWITLTGMSVAVVSNILLIPKFGYVGCAISACLSSFIMCLLAYLLGQKYFPIPYKTVRLITYTAITGILIWGIPQWHFSSTIINTTLHIGITIVWAVLLIFLERKSLKSTIHATL